MGSIPINGSISISDTMRLNFPILLALFWLIVQIGNILFNLQFYLLPQNRPFLYIVAILLIATVLVLGYLSICAFAPKFMYKINRKGRCPECYARLGSQKFCPKCGKDLEGRELARICPNCGHEELDPKQVSCPKCGKDFFK